MPIFTVRHGHRYQAVLSLNIFERLATNETIAKKFQDVGFSEVNVSGSGRTRRIEAIWLGEDASANMPRQIITVADITEPKLPKETTT